MPQKSSPVKKQPSDLCVGFTFSRRSSAADSVADFGKIANAISSYFNPRSSKVAIITESAARDSLHLRFLVRMREGTASASVRKALTRSLTNHASVSKDSIPLTVTTCDSEQKERLDKSELTKIEWNFPGASVRAATVATGDVQPKSESRAFSPRNATKAPWGFAPVPAVVLGSCTSAKSLGSGENSLRFTAAGTSRVPFLFITAKRCLLVRWQAMSIGSPYPSSVENVQPARLLSSRSL